MALLSFYIALKIYVCTLLNFSDAKQQNLTRRSYSDAISMINNGILTKGPFRTISWKSNSGGLGNFPVAHNTVFFINAIATKYFWLYWLENTYSVPCIKPFIKTY